LGRSATAVTFPPSCWFWYYILMIRLLAVMLVYQLHGIFNVKLAVKVVVIGE
jgi:hypothetical protein